MFHCACFINLTVIVHNRPVYWYIIITRAHHIPILVAETGRWNSTGVLCCCLWCGNLEQTVSSISLIYCTLPWKTNSTLSKSIAWHDAHGSHSKFLGNTDPFSSKHLETDCIINKKCHCCPTPLHFFSLVCIEMWLKSRTQGWR